MNPYLRAVLQTLFVTFLWSTRWVLIKIGLSDIPALTFAWQRYALAGVGILVVQVRCGAVSKQPSAISEKNPARIE